MGVRLTSACLLPAVNLLLGSLVTHACGRVPACAGPWHVPAWLVSLREGLVGQGLRPLQSVRRTLGTARGAQAQGVRVRLALAGEQAGQGAVSAAASQRIFCPMPAGSDAREAAVPCACVERLPALCLLRSRTSPSTTWAGGTTTRSTWPGRRLERCFSTTA